MAFASPTDNQRVELVLFAAASAVFTLPGYWWVTWLHRRDGYSWWLRITLGFVWSFAVFDLLAGPFLWFGGSFTAFAWSLALLWTGFAALSFWLSVGNAAPSGPRGVPSTEKQLHSASDKTPQRAFPTENNGLAVSRLAYAGVALYAAIAAVVVYLWSGHVVETQVRILAASPLILVVGCLLVSPLRKSLAPVLRFTADDEEGPPRLWPAAALGLILAQAAGAAVYFRPDWDDVYYLGAVLDYEHSPSFNDRDPTTREMIGVNAPHRAMCLELLGAVLCRLIGADPQTMFHSFLPAPFVLLAYGAYAALINQILPRKWLPLALVGLSGYFLWGVGEQFGAANHFLIRIWQGKAVMLHLAFPLLAALVLQFSRRVEWRFWLSLTAAGCCGLGFSSSAVFLGIALVSCLAIASVPAMAGARIKFLVLAAVACLPFVALGLAILNDPHGEITTAVAMPETETESGNVRQERSSQVAWALLLLDMCARRSSAEILWFLSLPMAALLLVDLRRWAYPMWYPLIFFATFGNPFLALWVAEHVTSQEGYYRLFWLFPVGPGLAIVFALAGRFCQQLRPAPTWARRDWLPLAVVFTCVAMLAVLPGKFVWSPSNRFDAFMFPQIGRNLEKMSPDLLEIVGVLDEERRAQRLTILCGEEVASYLVPWSPRFSYVMGRAMYLPGYGLDPAMKDGSDRFFLVCVAQSGRYAERLYQARMLLGHTRPIPAELLSGSVPLPQPALERLPRFEHAPDLLEQYRVDYVITSLPLWLSGAANNDFGRRLIAERDETLGDLGFERVYAGREHSLWKRMKDEG